MRPALLLNPTLSIRVGTAIEASFHHAGRWECATLDDPLQAQWLLSLTTPQTPDAIASDAQRVLGTSTTESAAIVDELLTHGALVSVSDAPPQSLEWWLELGWREALDFHLAVKDVPFTPCDEEARGVVPAFKTYPDSLPRVALPRSCARVDAASFGATILHARRPSPRFLPIALDELAELLAHTFRITKTSRSDGRFLPTEAYVVASRVRGLAAGIYHYSVEQHDLVRLRKGNFESDVYELGHRQEGLVGVAASLFLTTRWQPSMWRCRCARAYRTALFDLGHLVQTQHFVATAIGLECFSTPAIRDSEATELLGIADYLAESPMYLTAVGR